MSTDRRFSEEEIAAIFEHAAAAQRAAGDHPSADRGLTLAELHEIGAEVGISTEFITKAAASIGVRSSQAPKQKFLGLPISASYAVDLPGTFTEEDWGRLIADLRQTFGARGEISSTGSLREWRNGNLYAQVEQAGSGTHLRFGTLKGDAKPLILGGLGWFVWWVAIALVKAAELDFDPNAKIVFLAMLAVVGLVFAGFSAARLPSWSNLREQQMEAIAERALQGRGQRVIEDTRVDAHVTAESGRSVQEKARIEIPDDPSGGEEHTGRSDRTRT